MIFDYPAPRECRRHDPRGYKNYASYRPWLRDEFSFRCVYCLKREQWGQVTGEFDIDHFQPQTLAPTRRADYSNLLYSCRRCNGVKLDEEVADPFTVLTGERVRTTSDGMVQGADEVAEKLIWELDLNSPRLVKWRLLWMRIIALAEERDKDLLAQLIGYPMDLPNLRRSKPPNGNGRPGGIAQSCYALKARGLLPDSY